MRDTPSVLVIGGGPAGATAAGVLAKEGAKVTLLEKERFPREHVGESLQPAAITLLDTHLGLRSEIASAGFPRKYGAQYVWGETREPWNVLFDTRLERDLATLDEQAMLAGGYEHAFNVDRARFDHILLRGAARARADVREGEEAREVLVENGRVVGARTTKGEVLRADFVIDASGQRSIVGRAIGGSHDVDDMRATATYAYFEGYRGVAGPLGRHVQLVVSIEDGWVWLIPISDTVTSVGVVTQKRERLREERWDAIIRSAELPLEGAREVPAKNGARLRFARDWSYAHTRLAGPGYVLCGDAACFVDPILSGGVDFAVRMGCRAALAILRGLSGEPIEPLLAEYETLMLREYRAYLRLARYWYGNNRSVAGLFWEAHREIAPDAVTTPLRAFVYLTTGKHAADQHLRVFQEWQEKKMFAQLGVDRAELSRAWKKRREEA